MRQCYDQHLTELVAGGSSEARIYQWQTNLMEQFQRLEIPLAEAACVLMGCLADMSQLSAEIFKEGCN